VFIRIRKGLRFGAIGGVVEGHIESAKLVEYALDQMRD
jgi:hypothetical protein